MFCIFSDKCPRPSKIDLEPGTKTFFQSSASKNHSKGTSLAKFEAVFFFSFFKVMPPVEMRRLNLWGLWHQIFGSVAATRPGFSPPAQKNLSFSANFWIFALQAPNAVDNKAAKNSTFLANNFCKKCKLLKQSMRGITHLTGYNPGVLKGF